MATIDALELSCNYVDFQPAGEHGSSLFFNGDVRPDLYSQSR